MRDNFEVVIGIEIHAELKTKTKMFSATPKKYDATPNSAINSYDLGYPGTLPLPNKKAIELAILTANALNMKIDTLIKFDRKNYFYPDLSKGYQITQFFNPLGKNGEIEILVDGKTKIIDIERLHMEEDTAKQSHVQGKSLLDYNRSGNPLIEIVSTPTISSAKEAMEYVRTLREILVYLNVCDGKMEEGSLRVDVNISVRPFGQKKLNTKVEIKNINSISNIEKAVLKEINLQVKTYLTGKNVISQTKRYDSVKNEIFTMREKDSISDYRYIRETNLLPIKISNLYLNSIILNTPELPKTKILKFRSWNMNNEDILTIMSEIEFSKYIEKLHSLDKKLFASALKIFLNEILFLLKKNSKNLSEINFKPEYLLELIELKNSQKVSSRQAKVILEKSIVTEKRPTQIMIDENLSQITDENEIEKIVIQVVDKFKNMLSEYNNRPERSEKQFAGQVMKITKGRANPEITIKIIKKVIKIKLGQ